MSDNKTENQTDNSNEAIIKIIKIYKIKTKK